MRLGGLEFKPGRWPTLITVVLLGLLVSLGNWQLQRAEQKRALLAAYESARPDTTIRLQPGMPVYAGLAYQHAVGTGHYDATHQFLLDNRIHEGRAGYHVLTPFVLNGSKRAVLVNRGWLPLGASRERLPEIAIGAEDRTIQGRVRLLPERVFTLGEEQPRRGWPYRIQRVRTDALAGELGYSLLPFVLLLDPDQPQGYVRDWRPFPSRFGPQRHIGYAVQWFGLAVALLVIYLIVNIRKVESS